MVFRIKGPFPKSPSEINLAEPSEKSSTSSKGKAHVGEPSIQKDTIEESICVPSEFEDRSIPSEARDQIMIDEIIEEPKLSESQLKHIKDVVKILEKQPALKNDIRRTIVEELTKGYINPDQFKEYNQAIEEAGIKEAPPAVRARKTPKPRAKKSQQTDKAIIPMDIEQTSKLPKGKEIKNTQKKKIKIVTL